MRKIYSFMLMLLCATVSFAQMRVQGVLRQDVAMHSEPTSGGSKVDFQKINFWVGEGPNESALVVKFNDGTSTNAYVWGYKWNKKREKATGESMFRAIAKADPRLVLFTQKTNMGSTLCGAGYYPDGNVLDGVRFDTEAFSDNRISFGYDAIKSANLGQNSYPGKDNAITMAANAIEEAKTTGILEHPFNSTTYGYAAYDYDYWKTNSTKGTWRAAWYDGYWSYWMTDDATKDYTYSSYGFSNRELENGSVDAWSFVSDMSNWYSADMNNAELVYMQPTSTQVAQVKRLAEEGTATPTVYTITSPAEINALLESDDFIEGSTIKFSDDLKGKEVSDDMPDSYCEILKPVVIDGNGVILTGGVTFEVYTKTGSVTMRNMTIKNNSEGCIIYASDALSLHIENCNFENGDTQGYAGIVAVDQDRLVPMDLSVSGCVFANCMGRKGDGILKIKAFPSENDEEAAEKPLFTASVTSCTFVNNEGKKDIVVVYNRPITRFANNVIENNKCVLESAKDLVFPNEAPTTRVALVGYNVIKGTVNETVVPTETDVVNAEQADNLVLTDGEYVVSPTGAAYNHLPANTVIEGITFPEKDIRGETIDYTKNTHSGACQKVAESESDYSNGVFIVNEDWYGHQNSTINFLTNAGEWVYRVVQQENPGVELGCTAQYGQIYGDKFYVMSKQEKDPAASVVGGRINILDAKTMKMEKQIQTISTDKNGSSNADGRAFLGVDEHKGYVGTSNGIFILDLNSQEITGRVEGTENGASSAYEQLYGGQIGNMVRVNDRVFAVHQKNGLLVIDANTDKVEQVITAPEGWGFGSVVLSKDGNLWLSVADPSGSGMADNRIVRVDPNTLEQSVIEMPEGIYGPSNSWYAWTPDCFCASNQKNVLYWNGGENSWFSNYAIYKYDIDTNTFSKYLDYTDAEDGYYIYGCSFRVDPVSDDAYVSLFKGFGDPTYVVRKYDAEGKQLAEYPMISNYWFPSLPVFPDNEAPVIANPVEDVTLSADNSVSIDLKDLATDADNFDAAIVKSVKAVSNEEVLDAKMQNGSLVITPKQKGDATITIQVNSNGKLAETSFSVTVTTATGINGAESANGVVEQSRFGVDGKRISAPQKGVNIIRMSDGTVRKVVIK